MTKRGNDSRFLSYDISIYYKEKKETWELKLSILFSQKKKWHE